MQTMESCNGVFLTIVLTTPTWRLHHSLSRFTHISVTVSGYTETDYCITNLPLPVCSLASLMWTFIHRLTLCWKLNHCSVLWEAVGKSEHMRSGCSYRQHNPVQTSKQHLEHHKSNVWSSSGTWNTDRGLRICAREGCWIPPKHHHGTEGVDCLSWAAMHAHAVWMWRELFRESDPLVDCAGGLLAVLYLSKFE